MGVDTQHKRIRYDAAAVYDPSSKTSPRKQSKPLPTRFPDEDHSYQPLRRVQVTKLQQNSLPVASPNSSRAPSVITNERSVRGKRQRLANLTDSALWGFPVRYSPSDELAQDWEVAAREEGVKAAKERETLIEIEQRKEDGKRNATLTRQDYALYLYLANKYGALDAILYCSTSFPGRLFALLVDQSSRRLQRWGRRRMQVLRSYWVTELSITNTRFCIESGKAIVQRSFDNQRRACVFFNRMRWRYAASTFRSWYQFTQRQAEVRWRFQFAMQEDLRARFHRWRTRIQDIKAFKTQLKYVARKKQMHCAFAQWQEWQTRQQKLRVHLQTQWTKLQRACLAGWRQFTEQSKQEKVAAIRIQSNWRAYSAHKRFELCRRGIIQIQKMMRGYLGRKRACTLQNRLEIARCVESLTRGLEWEVVCTEVDSLRQAAVEKEMDRATRALEFIRRAENQAAQLVHNELDKVRKNDTHLRLKEKIHQLQEETKGASTSDALTAEATRLLIEEAIAMARTTATYEFLAQVDRFGRHINRPDAILGKCVVCSAALLNPPPILSQFPWVVDSSTTLLLPCSHNPAPTDPSDLISYYSSIIDTLHALDAMAHSQLLHAHLPPHVLWSRLEQLN